MKIVYVIHQFLPYVFAGAELYTYELAKEMARRGNDVCVVSMPHKLDYKYPAYTYKEFDFIKIKNKRNHLSEFKNIIRDIKPDIVNFQHLQHFSPRIIEITKAQDISIILQLHDYFYICQRIRLLNKEGKLCKTSINCPGCKEKRLMWKRYIEKVDLILANSHFVKDIYIKNGFDPAKIIVNYPGIDTKRVSKIRHLNSDILRFGFLGTVIKEKGIEVLIDAFNRLDKLVSLEIWGRIDSYKYRLLKKIENPQVEIKGEYDPFNIKDVLSGLDIVIIPSIWPEPWSIVKTEALTAGLGVLASSIGGIPEGMGDNRVLFFKPNNVISLCKAIKSVIANRDFWKIKKGNGHYVKTIKEDAYKVEYIYTQLLSKNLKVSKKKELSNNNKFILNSKIIHWVYGKEGIIIYKFNSKWKLAYILTDVGARFWELFTAFKSFDEIVHTIAIEYNSSKKEVKKDLKSFMNELMRDKIIIEAEKLKV